MDVVDTEAKGEAWEYEPFDLFESLGLGIGASERAKQLVLKGLIAELDEKIPAAKKRGKGRPSKIGCNIDMERAAAVLGADDLWRDKTDGGSTTQLQAIWTATKIDEILVNAGIRQKRLFGDMVTQGRLQDSVSKGLKELKEGADRFSKK